MLPTTKIAVDFTVADYLSLRPALDPAVPDTDAWERVLRAVRRRFEERFIAPVELLLKSSDRATPGFAILALDCLLIDALQAFREGRVSTGESSSAKSFDTFLDGPRFRGEFSKRDRSEFVHFVRNGLLHNGETRGDWLVRTKQKRILTVEQGARIIDRTRFHATIKEEFESYLQELQTGSSELRERFRDRMDGICGRVDTHRYYFAYGSNLQDSELRKTLAPVCAEGVACMPGWRIAFAKHSRTRSCDAATIEPDPCRMLWGYVYRVTNEGWIALEKRERGYKSKRVSALLMTNGCNLGESRRVIAFTFVGDKLCSHNCGPSEEYLRIVIGGAEEKNLPVEYVNELRSAGRAPTPRRPGDARSGPLDR